jgi:hypothetical protein
MQTTFFVVSAKFSAHNQNFFVEVIVRYSEETDSNTAIAYLEHPKRKEDVKVFENFPTNVKEFILAQGKWKKCTVRELGILNSQN